MQDLFLWEESKDNYNLTQNDVNELMDKYIPIFKYIPDVFKTYDMCIDVVTHDPLLIHFVPVKFRTLDLCKITLNSARANNLNVVGIFNEFPREILTKELCDLAFKLSLDLESHLIYYIPEEFRTEDMYFESIIKQPEIIKITPTSFFNKEMVEKLFKYNHRILKYVPIEFITYDMCIETINSDIYNFCYIPKEILTQELCQMYFDKYGENLKDGGYSLLTNIPIEFRTYDLCKKAVEINPYNIFFIPKKYLNKELIRLTYNN